MRIALAAAAIVLLAAPAAAQDDRKAAINALLDKAIAEHTIFLNCTATDPDGSEFVARGWQSDVLAAVAALAEAGFSSDEIAAFTTRASIDALMMKDRPFGEVIEFCNTNGPWMRQFYEMRYVVLPLAIKQATDGTPAAN